MDTRTREERAMDERTVSEVARYELEQRLGVVGPVEREIDRQIQEEDSWLQVVAQIQRKAELKAQREAN
jgi:hypothetical protein